jgi:hypothetical protein
MVLEDGRILIRSTLKNPSPFSLHEPTSGNMSWSPQYSARREKHYSNIEQVDMGCRDIDGRLRNLGADTRRINA